jgi:hypothetical protein
MPGAGKTEEKAMKYMILMNATPADWKSFGSMAPEDIGAHIGFMKKLNEELRASGELVLAEGLTGPTEAKIVRARGGGAAPAVTDGPFLEAKEFLAGFWILDCRTLERAIELAARISAAPGRGGVPMNFAVDVRPVGVAPQT